MSKKGKIVKLVLSLALVGSLLLTGCASNGNGGDDADATLSGKRVRVVIGSTSTGGDTYLTADTVTRYLSEKLDFNSSVDPIGASRALEEIVTTRPDGTTIMMFHDMTYLGVAFGAYEDRYALENFVVGPKFGYSQLSTLAASGDAPYDDLAEMAEWLEANPNETVRIAIEAGGVSQLVFNAYYSWVDDTYGEEVSSRVRAFMSGSTAEKAQALWDGNCELIFGDVTALEQYVSEDVDAQIRMKLVGITSGERIPGKDYKTFAEMGITLDGEPFVFDKEYNIFYPAGIPQSIIDEVDAAVAEITQDPNYIKDLEDMGFRAGYLSSEDNKEHMYQKRDSLMNMIQNSPSLDELTAQ
jgi:tripartite-type tricarboxylate transporter receptor subunit TctC